jgi:two-component system, sensor histidine kinase PdtaS
VSETVAAVTSSLDLAQVSASVARNVARALEADACFVYIYDEGPDELVLQAVYGTELDASAPRPRMHPGEGLTGVAAATRAPVAVPTAASDDVRFKAFANLDEDRFDSLLAVPILDRRERLAGAMNVRTVGRRDWAPDEIDLLETIAAQVAQAMENALLYERSQRRVAELEALARISEAVSQSLYQEETLQKIVQTTADAVRADCCALVVATPEGPTVAQRAGGAEPSDAELLAAAARAPFNEAGWVAVPLQFKTQTIGALVCSRSRRRLFGREERALLESVAAQAAIAVESGRGVMRGLVAQEIHHRVKNNLQTVASLLRLRGSAGDPSRALADSVDRVLSIAEVHDLLTASREGAVDLADLVRRLATMLGHGLGAEPAPTELAPVTVPGETATSVALVFCELYANALEHGGGDASVRLAEEDGTAVLEVRDRGPGLPRDFDPQRSLGLKIAYALVADDLGGTIELVPAHPGVRAVVRWSV